VGIKKRLKTKVKSPSRVQGPSPSGGLGVKPPEARDNISNITEKRYGNIQIIRQSCTVFTRL